MRITLMRFATGRALERSGRILYFIRIAALTSLFAACLALPCAGQTTPPFEEGAKPFGSYQWNQLESVNLMNGLLNVHIPIVTYPQRGGILHVGFNLVYRSARLAETSGPPNGSCGRHGCSLFHLSQGGLLISPDFMPEFSHTNATSGFIQFFDGTSHEAEVAASGGGKMFTVDGSAYSISATAVNPPCIAGQPDYHDIISDSQGTQYTYECNGLISIEDPNGNKIDPIYTSTHALSGWTDTMGRTINVPPFSSTQFYGSTIPGQTTNLSGCPAASNTAYLWSLPTLNGGTMTLKVCVFPMYINYFIPNCEPATCGEDQGPYSEINAIILPNGTSWQFGYDDVPEGNTTQLGSGNLNSITFPSGGTITYQWLPMCTTTNGCQAQAGQMAGGLISRTVNPNDGSGPQQWTYSQVSGSGTPPNLITTVSDPLGNTSVHTFTALLNSYSYYETLVQTYDGSGTLQQTLQTDYTGSANPFIPTAPMNIVPIRVTTTWPNGQVSKIEKDYTFDVALAGATTGYGNVVAQREYDYGSGSPGPLLRQTSTTYQYQSSGSYATNNLVHLPATVKVTNVNGTQVALTTYAYDAGSLSSSGVSSLYHDSSPPDANIRGNRTSISKWLNTTGGSLTSSATFFDTGEVNTTKDPSGNSTTYAYSTTYQGAYRTAITNALNQTTTLAYDFNTGLTTSTTDPNSQSTTFTYETMWRPASVSYPDKGNTSYAYNDAPPSPTVTTTKLATPDPSVVNVVTLDGLGRSHQKQITSISPNIITNTTFDGLGRLSTVSNPHFSSSSPTDGTTTYAYDPLGRTIKLTEPDGSFISTSYSGSTTTVTDEAGHQRKTATDGLNRLTSLWEAPAGFDYLTTYGYDALDDLTSVVQNGSRNRSFAYDSISRLTSSTNPESGTVSYTYDSDGNVLTRTDARGISTTYSYDALNRVTLKSYSDGTTAAHFVYDINVGWNVTQTNIAGRMVEAYTYTSAGTLLGSIFGYDPLGRTVMNNQCAPHACPSGGYPVTYTYDLAGGVTAFSNGAGITLSYAIDGAQRTTKMTSSYVDSQHPATLATVAPTVGFYPNGAIRGLTLGNGLTETSAYNSRLQPCRMNLNSSGTLLGTCTDAIPSGNVQDLNFGFNSGSADNGNVVTLVGTGQQTFNRSYVYDQLNRLSTMADSATNQACKGVSWIYDAWGNRTAQNVTLGSCLSPQTPVGTNNRLTVAGFTYDAAGNVTHDVNHSYLYDAENRLTQIDGGSTASYIYGADGHRVEKATPAGYVDYLYDLAGNVTSEWTTSSSFTGNNADYDYMGDQIVAEYIADTTYFILKDHLGSTRLITGVTQNIVDNMDYLPFGEQIAGGSATTHKFTSKERDTESGNDHFEARYYSSAMGRFLIPDWSAKIEPVPYSKLDDPQSLNLYSYVLNNPLSNVDTDGHACTGLYFNTGSGFCQRATEYGLIDAKPGVQSQTRFFAAANATSQALADVATPVSGMLVSGKTASFLEGVGENLEKLNRAESTAIEKGSLSGPNLDQQLVHNEQSSVQDQLNNFHQSDPAGYTKAISEINASLNGLVVKGLEQLQPTDKAYASVLAGVRKDLGRDIDFSKQSDREAIGNAIIKHIRQEGGCDLNGSKQHGCP